MVRKRQLGESKVGCIFGLIVLGIAIFIAIKVIPVRVAVSALQDFMEEAAQRVSMLSDQPNNPISAQLAEKVYQQAKSDNLPVRKEDVKVTVGNGRVEMELKYTVPIDLVVYTYQWNVEHKVDRLVF